MKVQVMDAIMGYGKSTYAIEHINSKPDNFYFVALPLLEEVERYKKKCTSVELVEPSDEETSKGEALLSILRQRKSVVTTHHLFEEMTDSHLNAIRRLPLVRGEKVLILDETIDLVRSVPESKLSARDLRADREQGFILVNEKTGKVQWNTEHDVSYNHHDKLKALCDTGQLFFLEDRYIIVEVSTEFLACFDRILIMTYRWDSSIMAVQLGQVHGVEVEKRPLNEERVLECYRYIADHLVIPDDYCAGDMRLSKSGLEGNEEEVAKLIRMYTDQAMKDYDIPLDLVRYTTFKEAHGFSFVDYFKSVKIGQYQKKDSQGKVVPFSFLSHTTLGTNEHSCCKLMVYGLSKHLHPGVGAFFTAHGASISYEQWSLSSMLQWLFRGCIRDRDSGEKMVAIIPSSRMRKLAKMWLADIKRQADQGFLDDYSGKVASLAAQQRANKWQQFDKLIKKSPHLEGVLTFEEYIGIGGPAAKRKYKHLKQAA